MVKIQKEFEEDNPYQGGADGNKENSFVQINADREFQTLQKRISDFVTGELMKDKDKLEKMSVSEMQEVELKMKIQISKAIEDVMNENK